ncbi:hypothetical protein [Leptospira alexanderi]|uniref:hypothetical protein n=1 Tax=Leptospira alexanderi TaxID=100053 RepID=UPI000990A144|nr:hypothetical protein [Leptospira alexanderi]
MERIPLTPSRDLQGLKLQIDGFNDSFEILKIKEEGLTIYGSFDIFFIYETTSILFSVHNSYDRKQCKTSDILGRLVGLRDSGST